MVSPRRRVSRVSKPSYRSLGLLCAIAFTLTACGGGSQGSQAIPVTPVSHGKGTGSATFVVKVPQQTPTQSSSRRPQYISPATQSMTIDIDNTTTNVNGVVNETANLTIGSSGCTSSLASTICTLTITGLQPDNYTATLATYDQTNAGGNVLSQAQAVAFTITAGADNTIALTLSGVPSSIVASVLSASTYKILVEALDADGDIIAGPGAPAFSASKTSGSLGVTLTQPTQTSPNVVVATPGGNGSAVLQFTAAYSDDTCSLAGAVCTASFTLAASSPAIFVASAYQSGHLTEYVPPYTSTPTHTILVAYPQALVFDAGGDLFVGSQASESIAEYAPPYSGSAEATLSSSSGLDGGGSIALDASGNLYAAGGFLLQEFAAPYSGAPEGSVSVGGAPSQVVANGSDIFVSTGSGASVLEYATPISNASTPIATMTSNVPGPGAMAFDSSGNLYVANETANTVTEFSPPFSNASVGTVISSGITDPQGIAIDAAGDLFVANCGMCDGFSDSVTEYAAPVGGASTAVATITNAVDFPSALAFDSGGDLWVAQRGGNAVSEYTPPFSNASAPTVSLSGTAALADVVAVALYGTTTFTLTPDP